MGLVEGALGYRLGRQRQPVGVVISRRFPVVAGSVATSSSPAAALSIGSVGMPGTRLTSSSAFTVCDGSAGASLRLTG